MKFQLLPPFSEGFSNPFLYPRWTLESLGTLEPRKSALEEDFEEEEDKEENDQLDDEMEDVANEKVSLSSFRKNSIVLVFFHVVLCYY